MNPHLRKWIVSLKRHPHNIPLVFLVVCCMIYTFQLTAHSNASMYVASQIIAFYVFIITLFSVLTIFSFVNSVGKKVKHKWLMTSIVYVLIGVQIFLDGLYLSIINYETVLRDNPVPVTQDIATSSSWTVFHLIALSITLLSIIFLPIYHKLLLKIDTRINDSEIDGVLDIDEKIITDEGEI